MTWRPYGYLLRRHKLFTATLQYNRRIRCRYMKLVLFELTSG